MPLFGFMLRRVGAGRPPWERARLVVALLREGNSGAAESMAAHCDVAATMAERLGLGPTVHEPMRLLFERWDGKGPVGMRGEAIPLVVRLVQLADLVESYRSAATPTRPSPSPASAPGRSSIRRSPPRSNGTPTTSSPGSTATRPGTR